jgi:hypothetical protein
MKSGRHLPLSHAGITRFESKGFFSAQLIAWHP